MSVENDTFDDIDKSISERLDELQRIESVPVGLKARVIRHYSSIRYANKILGWSYARIASDVLKPAGMLISPATLRIYMEDIAKKSGGREANSREAKPPQHKRTASTAARKKAVTHADKDHATLIANANDSQHDTANDIDAIEIERLNDTETHAALRRARART